MHCDVSSYTVSVALSSDDADSGRLVFLHGGKCEAPARTEGDATVYSNDVLHQGGGPPFPPPLLHGVSAVRAGARYALVVFFELAAPKEPAQPRQPPAKEPPRSGSGARL
eukprot:gene9190-20035_t